jgi:hypothetical protein
MNFPIWQYCKTIDPEINNIYGRPFFQSLKQPGLMRGKIHEKEGQKGRFLIFFNYASRLGFNGAGSDPTVHGRVDGNVDDLKKVTYDARVLDLPCPKMICELQFPAGAGPSCTRFYVKGRCI